MDTWWTRAWKSGRRRPPTTILFYNSYYCLPQRDWNQPAGACTGRFQTIWEIQYKSVVGTLRIFFSDFGEFLYLKSFILSSIGCSTTCQESLTQPVSMCSKTSSNLTQNLAEMNNFEHELSLTQADCVVISIYTDLENGMAQMMEFLKITTMRHQTILKENAKKGSMM